MITEILLNDEEKWNSVVKSFQNYDVYYLPGYVKAFQINGDGMPVLLYFEGNNVRAMNVVMKRDVGLFDKLSLTIKEGEYYDIVTPYGYGGFVVEGNDTTQLESEYMLYCRNHNIICEFVRFHPTLLNYKQVGNIYEQKYLGDTIAIDTKDPETIWNNFTSKNRNMVRKAQKSGLKVYWTRDNKIIDTFMEIYNLTMDKDNAESYYYFKRVFYESVLNDLKYNALWFYTKIGEEVVAISIFLFANGKMHYHLSASRKEYQSYAPTNLLLYEAALWASENGYSCLHLGGGLGAGKDSLYSFKKAFNRQSESHFYIGKRVFIEEIYTKLVEERKKDTLFNVESNYFPLYRA